VTDGAWFIGSHLVDRPLLADGTEVVVDNFGLLYPRPVKEANLADAPRSPRCRLLELDIHDAPWVSALMERVRPDAIVHLPARAGVRPSTEAPGLYADVNVTGTIRWLDAASGIEPRPRFIYASSSCVYGDQPDASFREIDPVDLPVSPYAATKKASKLLANSFHDLRGLPVTGLPFLTAHGSRDRSALALAKFTCRIDRGGQVPTFGDGATRRDYTFVTDILDRIIPAIDRRWAHHLYNLGSCDFIERRLIDGIAAGLGKEPIIRGLPEQPGDVRPTYADVGRSAAGRSSAPKKPAIAGSRPGTLR
jgi:UDP-glucuronate 4-epimerase